jgi:hypothetical protein
MVGGEVTEIVVLNDWVRVNVKGGHKNRDYCGIYVEKSSESKCIRLSDRI